MRKDIDTTRENGLVSHDLYSEGTAGVTLMSNGQQYFYQPHQAENVNYLLDLYPRHPGRLEPTHIDLNSFNKENVHEGNLYTLSSVS